MQFEYTEPQTELEKLWGGFYCINAFGRIEIGDGPKFGKFLQVTGPPPLTAVYIDSSGGDVEAALEIGRSIRQASLSTTVGRYTPEQANGEGFVTPRKRGDGQCLSAATLMYLGGRLRYFSDRCEFGVHRFSYANPSPENIEKSQILAAKIAKYVEETGPHPHP
ncbi:MAG: hypothetical protein JJ938_10720 [Roseicyclus sp.]|nr:hypothetical protein [Roseicyclus sp.]MBO6625345.1 hypothetical protein [Roseicyclus sp.]MBO6922686.1 hypothetical protein [Roseicyclus sp.]